MDQNIIILIIFFILIITSPFWGLTLDYLIQDLINWIKK